MTSKLFHAVVGVGISLGSVTACGGSIADDDVLGSPDAAATSKPDSGKPHVDPIDAAQPDAFVAIDAGVPKPDATVELDASAQDATAPLDAALDAPQDAIVEAFCDVTWAITKSGRTACGPIEGCESEPAPFCYGFNTLGQCQIFPLVCNSGQWQCMAGTPKKNFSGDQGCQ